MSYSQRMEVAALNYAKADRSDPFAYSRTMTHLKNGISSLVNQHGQDAFYSATPFQDKRSYNNGKKEVEYHVTAYKDIIRPYLN